MNGQLKYGAVLSYASLGINMLIGLIYTPWMINSIGRESFGLYTLAHSIITLFVFDFGLSAAVTRFVSTYIAEGRPDKVANFLGITTKIYLIISALLFVSLTAFFFFIPEVYDKLSPTEIEQFKVVYVIAAAFSVISFPFIPLNGILIANEKMIQLKICEVIHKLVIVGTMSTCLLLGYGLYALVSVYAFAGIVMILLKLYCIRRFTQTRVNIRYSDRAERNSILKFSGWTTVVAISQRLIFNITPSILGIMSGSVSIAIFGIATTIEGYTYSFASALNGLFYPKISRIMVKEDGNVLPLMIKVGRIQILIISTIFIGLICVGQDFIRIWVGEQFLQSYWCILLIVFPSVVHLSQEIGLSSVILANKVKYQAYVFMIMAAANIAIAFPLAKMFGAVGVSISICAAYLLRTIGMNIIFRKQLNIDIAQFFRQTFLKLSIPIVAVTALGIVLSQMFEANNWPLFIAKGCILCGIIFLTYWLFCLNGEEKALLKSFFKHRKQ